jgi:hypothetical protein
MSKNSAIYIMSVHIYDGFGEQMKNGRVMSYLFKMKCYGKKLNCLGLLAFPRTCFLRFLKKRNI